eukprot:TRINITY_DN21989_c0_g2_i3.p1 TRINITY_DN21989_c0_g2~~TRINITY_DN21989_c0_g2_i3.p1  ORF type:complete len:421 (-),score=95.38 TRINITY_DN21989_c0_g2_i3:171-1433(-)
MEANDAFLFREDRPTRGNRGNKTPPRENKTRSSTRKLVDPLGDVNVLIPGRHRCSCHASRHKLLTNCLSCGRIICEQEGWGECLFCGRHPGKMTKHAKATVSESAAKAAKHKDRLLEFQRNSAKRTSVIDDQCDWFENADVNVWLNQKEKDKARQIVQARTDKAEARKRQMRVTLDLAGRRVVEAVDTDSDDGADAEEAEQQPTLLNPYLRGPPPVFTKGGQRKSPPEPVRVARPASKIQHTDWEIGDLHTEEWEEEAVPSPVGRAQGGWAAAASQANRGLWATEHAALNNSEFVTQQAAQTSACLSMHQPWASLLVAGIKTVEGRSWPTTHRGLMWIASTAQPTDRETVAALRAQYSHVPSAKFPKEYPHGHLLGVVNIVDCITQAEYQVQCPDDMREENGSEHLFVCTDPHTLSLIHI